MPRPALTRALAGAVALLAVAAPAHAAVPGLGGWDRPAQRAVAQAGVLPNLAPGRFAGQAALTAGQLRDALGALADRQAPTQDKTTFDNGADTTTTPAPVPAPVSVPSIPPTVESFDALLVAQLGLSDVADDVQAETARAGLAPPPRFGTEVVARLLGLRYDHPAAADRDELYPTDVITRAEAAWSLAKILSFSGWEADAARQVLADYRLPGYSSAQRAALRVAVSRIGMPYVWGGETDLTSNAAATGPQAHGGYDCSGFVWRVFKLSGLPQGTRIGGRTAAQMAGEIPKARRLSLSALKPTDLMFFGSAKPWQKATEARIDHVAIVLGGGFLIQSSGQGVAVAPIAGWYMRQFAWGRAL